MTKSKILLATALATLLVAPFAGCNGTSLDDGDSANVVLQIGTIQPTPITSTPSTADPTTCTFTITDWTINLANKPKNADAVTSPFNDIVLESMTISYQWFELVLRGGYGINYSPPLLDGWAYGWFTGFNGSNFIASNTGRPGGGDDPAYQWDKPYPVYTAKLPNYDPAQLNNGSIAWYPPETAKMPRTQNWNFGIQFELPWQTRLEANYVGTKGSRLNEGYKYSLDQLNPSNLSLGDTLLEDIRLHPEIKKPYASFSGTVAQGLRKYPQYRGVTAHRYNGGWSNYNSLQITATKRTSHGLSFLVAYTWSKALATSDDVLGYSYYGGVGQSIFNRKLDYSVSQLNAPQDLKITRIYDLPLGDRRESGTSPDS